jgi:replicative DNA helicase
MTSELTQTEIIEERPFGINEEKAIISLAFDMPEFFSQIGRHISWKHFQAREHKYVYTIIEQQFKKHGCVPTRELALDIAWKSLSVDDDWEPIINAIKRESNHREIPIIKDTLLQWTQKKAFGLLYGDEAFQALQHGDYEILVDLFEKARRITDVSNIGLKFFENVHLLFQADTEIKLTCGINALDCHINEGGPIKGDVFVWIAPTGVGKSLMLVNSGRICVEKGLKVLHVTLEDSVIKTMQRYMGSFTDEIIKTRNDRREAIEQRLFRLKSSTTGDLRIVDFPQAEITVDTLHQLIATLKRTNNWSPDVLIVDYLEQMMPRRQRRDDKDYNSQGDISEELCSLAKKEKVLLFTATQTNRDGIGNYKNGKSDADGEVIGVNKIAESYAKAMPVHYCVSINQTPDEYERGIVRLYIAKNRNGPKFKTVRARINYPSMHVKQDEAI